MPEISFDDLTDVYEAMIDWPRRLAAETPFFRGLFERAKAKRVADLACGTGRHAAMFHSWGLQVEASDISPMMIQHARETFGEPAGLSWVVRGFDRPPAGVFDAVVCVGNSLALAPDKAAVGAALRQMLSALRPGGVLAIQVLNLWRIPPGPCLWQKVVRKDLSQGRSLIVKGVHRCDDMGYVELVVVGDDAAEGKYRSHSARFLGIRAGELETMVRAGGAEDVAFFGGHQQQPYDANTSTDLIMVAVKS